MYGNFDKTVPWFYTVAAFLLRWLLRLFCRWEVYGITNVPPGGPVLIVSNHLSMMDPPLLAVSLNRKTIFMAKKELFQHGLTRYFLRGFGSFPVDRGQFNKQTLLQAEKVLANGLALTMFPEGMRSKNGTLGRGFPGTALIASRNTAPLLPVGITGTEKLKGMSWLFKRPALRVNIGPPFYLPSANSRSSKQELADCTDLIMEKIAGLLPLAYRGHYAGKFNAD